MKKETSYILLGEGDYTYSLDACRYLSSTSSSSLTDDTTTNDKGDLENNSNVVHHHKITCTGIDTLAELQTKYHNIDFVLNKLHSYNNNNKTNKSLLLQGCSNNNIVTTNIIHGVNAVSTNNNIICNNNNSINSNTNNSSSYGYDHVIFNHPHIGTENVSLHTQLLSHLFYTSTKLWMKRHTGLLHVTLVLGQCERWDCINSATQHDLILLRRDKFIPPPPPPRTTRATAVAAVDGSSSHGSSKSSNSNNNSSTTYYNLRRHQSGRSFANRRSVIMTGSSGDSETLVFGRKCDYQYHYQNHNSHDNNTSRRFLLPWECDASGDESKHVELLQTKSTNSVPISNDNNNNTADNDIDLTLFTCKYCNNNNKSFREYRSLKNHLLSLHPTCDEIRSLLDTTKEIKKKKIKKKTNMKDSKKRKSVTTTSDIHDDDYDKCQEIPQQQQQQQHENEDLQHCNDKDLICPTTYTCSICNNDRIFPNKDALLSHQRATHFGVHKDIKPDWYRQHEEDDTKLQVNIERPCCSICHRQFAMGMDEVIHALEFVPSSSAIAKAIIMEHSSKNNDNNNNNDVVSAVIHHTSSPGMYKCVYCSKVFTQLRAQRQHENFCSSRQQQLEQSTISTT